MADYLDSKERLDNILDQQERRIAALFRTAVEALKDEIDLDELSELLEQGRVGDALDKLKHVAEQLGSASNVAFVTAGQSTADFMLNAGVGRVVFDQVNTRAVAAMQASRLTLVREFTDEQRRATSLALVTGVEAGTNPLAAARNFRDSIGLTERQWGAVANYRRSLERVGFDPSAQEVALGRALRDKRGDAQVRRAVREGKPLAPEKIDWLIRRYTSRYIKHRAEVIGRTEALRAANEGNEEMYRQAIESGVLEEGQIERTWETRLDGRERTTHLLLNGQKRRWGDVWTTRHGTIRYPGDPEAPASETVQCFPGSALINPAGLERVIVRHYCGELVQLRAGGVINVTVTPNHPVLTQRGWVAAREVVKGDYLVQAFVPDGMADANPDVEQRYSSAEHLAGLAKLSRNVQRARPEIVNFHGEVPDHEIEIITPPSKLRDRFKAASTQLLGQFPLMCADVALGHLLFARLVEQDFMPLNAIERGQIGSFRKFPALLGSQARQPDAVRLTAGAGGEAQLLETIDHDIATKPGLPSHYQDGRLGAVEALNGWMKGAAFFRPMAVSFTGSTRHDGPVYNFETATGLVINDGVVFHNCRCALSTRIRRR